MSERDEQLSDNEVSGSRQGVGETLRKAREAANLKREELAERLKLSPKIVTALEEEDFDSLPSPVFVRGYLNTFARHLGVNAEELLAAYSQEEVATQERSIIATVLFHHQDELRKGKSTKWVGILVLLVVLGLVLVWLQDEIVSQFGQQSSLSAGNPAAMAGGENRALPIREEVAAPAPTSAEPGQTETPAAPMPVDQAREEVATAATGEPPAVEPQPAPAPVVAPKPVPRATPPAVNAPTPTPAPAAVVPETAAATPGAPARLSLRANGDSWTEVTDAEGKRLVYELLRTGADRSVEGTAPFRVFLGNAPAVSIEFNGSEVPIPRISSEGVARLTVGSP